MKIFTNLPKSRFLILGFNDKFPVKMIQPFIPLRFILNFIYFYFIINN